MPTKLTLQAELVGDGAQQLVVEAGELALRVDADARRRVRQRADGQHAGRAEAERVDVDGVERFDGGRRVLVRRRALRGGSARLVGSALALSTPGGAHWSASASAGVAIPRLKTSSAISATANALTVRPVKGVIQGNVAAGQARNRVALIQNATEVCLARADGLNTPRGPVRRA